MAERIHPSSKPLNPPPKALNPTAASSFPSSKAQLYGAPRPHYRPKQYHHRRSCCCACFLWTTFILVILLILLAVAGLGFWVIYQPQRPSLAVKSIHITRLNITQHSALDSKTELSFSTRNPNRKMVFIYNPISISMRSSHGVDIGNGSLPGFVHEAKNTQNLKASVSSGGRELDSDSEDSLRADLKKKNGLLPLEIELETKVKLKVGSVETPKVGIRVVCKGIQVTVPKRRSDTSRMKSSGGQKCKVGMEFKIWRFNF